METLIGLFIGLAILLLIVNLFRLPTFKGKCGEILVAFWLKVFLNAKEYHVLNNVMIPDDDGGTTQIDHIVLSQYGIFVIETKNMKGWIFGQKNAERWTQQIFRVKNQFQNPFRQNYKHLMCLSKLTGLPPEYFHHIIVFVGGAEIKTRDTLPESLAACAWEMLTYIKKQQEIYFPEEMVSEIERAIQSGRIANTRANTKAHVAYVKSIKNAKE